MGERCLNMNHLSDLINVTSEAEAKKLFKNAYISCSRKHKTNVEISSFIVHNHLYQKDLFYDNSLFDNYNSFKNHINKRVFKDGRAEFIIELLIYFTDKCPLSKYGAPLFGMTLSEEQYCKKHLTEFIEYYFQTYTDIEVINNPHYLLCYMIQSGLVSLTDFDKVNEIIIDTMKKLGLSVALEANHDNNTIVYVNNVTKAETLLNSTPEDRKVLYFHLIELLKCIRDKSKEQISSVPFIEKNENLNLSRIKDIVKKAEEIHTKHNITFQSAQAFINSTAIQHYRYWVSDTDIIQAKEFLDFSPENTQTTHDCIIALLKSKRVKNAFYAYADCPNFMDNRENFENRILLRMTPQLMTVVLDEIIQYYCQAKIAPKAFSLFADAVNLHFANNISPTLLVSIIILALARCYVENFGRTVENTISLFSGIFHGFKLTLINIIKAEHVIAEKERQDARKKALKTQAESINCYELECAIKKLISMLPEETLNNTMNFYELRNAFLDYRMPKVKSAAFSKGLQLLRDFQKIISKKYKIKENQEALCWFIFCNKVFEVYSEYWLSVSQTPIKNSSIKAYINLCLRKGFLPDGDTKIETAFIYYTIHTKEPIDFADDQTQKCYEIKETIKDKRKMASVDSLENLLFSDQTPNKEIVTMNDIDLMSGFEFEEFICKLFTKLGHKAKVTKSTGDQGIDIISESNGIKYGIQVKCYSGSVGNSAVQEAVAGKAFYSVDKAIVITNSHFTKSACELAQSNGVILWDRELLEEKLKIFNK